MLRLIPEEIAELYRKRELKPIAFGFYAGKGVDPVAIYCLNRTGKVPFQFADAVRMLPGFTREYLQAYVVAWDTGLKLDGIEQEQAYKDATQLWSIFDED